MAIVTLYKNNNVLLESDRTLIPQEEISLISSMVEKAEDLQSLLGSEQERIRKAEAAGYDAGYEKGQTDGYEAALEHIAVKLLTLAKEANAVREVLEQQSGNLALKIVQKIAYDMGPGPTIAALAATAAKQMVPRESIVLRVSPSNEHAVKQTIGDSIDTYKQIIEVAVDPLLKETDCILETEFGQIKAGLEMQIQALREQFRGF